MIFSSGHTQLQTPKYRPADYWVRGSPIENHCVRIIRCFVDIQQNQIITFNVKHLMACLRKVKMALMNTVAGHKRLP